MRLSLVLLVLAQLVILPTPQTAWDTLCAMALLLALSGLVAMAYALAAVGLAPTWESLESDTVGYDSRVRAPLSMHHVQALATKA